MHQIGERHSEVDGEPSVLPIMEMAYEEYRPKSSEWLASVGIHTLDDVAKLGVVETYVQVKAAYP